jgi:transcriptional regulator with XRE-family HTH domain
LSFASNLKSRLDEKEMKPSELAKAIGKNKSSISQYLKGINIPKDETKEKIAEVLECSIEDLDADAEDGQDLEINSCNNVPIWKAAKLLGKSEEFIRISLQTGTAPFGFGAKKKSKWSYHISPKKLAEYIGDYE